MNGIHEIREENKDFSSRIKDKREKNSIFNKIKHIFYGKIR